MALLTLDVDTLTVTNKNLTELADKLAQVVVDWNVNKNYVAYKMQGKAENEGNCQDFVDAVLNKLDVVPTFSGALLSFLNDMRNSGTCEMQFKADPAFVETFGLEKQVYVFTNHVELDQFAAMLFAKSPMFKIDYQSEYQLYVHYTSHMASDTHTFAG